MPSLKNRSYFSGEQERLIHEINSHSGVWYALTGVKCAFYERTGKDSQYILCVEGIRAEKKNGNL